MNQKQPEVLWHYTTQEGLLGIIESGSLHASNIFYLNDATEYTYAEEVIIDVLNGYMQNLTGPVNSMLQGLGVYPDKSFDKTDLSSDTAKYWFIETVRDVIKELKFDPIYILSFSAKKDDLSQWRGYCPHGNGFSIGFRAKGLFEQIKRLLFNRQFTKCIYKKSEQEDEIKKIIDASLNDTMEIKRLMKRTIMALLDIIPQMKDISFEDEEEWRAILIKTSDLSLGFRTGKSMIVPYIKIPLPEKWMTTTVLDSVIVGPTPHKGLSKRSVESVLQANGIKLKTSDADGCEVKLSKIPYRIL